MIENFKYHHLDKVTSTQTIAKEMIKEHRAIHGTIITTDEQTAGYGKHSREWYSLSEDLIMTTILKPNVKINMWSQICFIYAISLGEALLSYQPDINLQYKWVNDILIDGRKTSGILLENFNDQFLIVGIAVNIAIRNEDDERIEQPFTSLANCNINISKADLMEKLLKNVQKFYNHWEQHGFEPIKNLWLSRAYKLNEQIIVQGEQNFSGIMTGIDEYGNLILDKQQKVSAGDLFFN